LRLARVVFTEAVVLCDMATIHFRDDADSVTAERVFVTENGWVALSEEDEPPVLYPADRVEKIKGREDIFYDSTVLTEEVGAKRVDEDGHVLQEPDLERRMIVEVEIY
jgi:hypothetical protein